VVILRLANMKMAEGVVDLTTARLLACVKQGLLEPPSAARPNNLLECVQQLHCVQLDPTNVVARSQILVLFARLGSFDLAELERILWIDKSVFHYWAHGASWVLTKDFPIHGRRMKRAFPPSTSWGRRVRGWLEANREMQTYVLRELRRHGPLRSRDLDDRCAVPWTSTGWTAGQNVGRMLDFLLAMGKVMVAGRSGQERLWEVADRWLPEWTPRQLLTEQQMVRRAAEISLRCLGIATQAQIRDHFVRGDYSGLSDALRWLLKEGKVLPIVLQDGPIRMPGRWYIHSDDLEVLESCRNDEHTSRTTVLSPFDNLICDRARAEVLFGFSYRTELYVPSAQRRYGYFSLPILHRGSLIARADSALDRKRHVLKVMSIHVENEKPASKEISAAVILALSELARFVGSGEMEAGPRVSSRWRRLLS
jgi:uncharacterized protein